MTHDPYVELKGQALRDLVVYCLEWSRTDIGRHGGQDRMAERGFTGGEILAVLEKGVLSTNQCVGGIWRYSARRSDAEIIFTFDLDEDGNMLIVVTLMRKD